MSIFNWLLLKQYCPNDYEILDKECKINAIKLEVEKQVDKIMPPIDTIEIIDYDQRVIKEGEPERIVWDESPYGHVIPNTERTIPAKAQIISYSGSYIYNGETYRINNKPMYQIEEDIIARRNELRTKLLAHEIKKAGLE